ncbi:hypothetical protein BX600DRAFT_450755 [Xylariales sp. PMI_506]|nr:hypothetical protein BX600DRAFT_450755 [Xylariales sp. PMI_506]
MPRRKPNYDFDIHVDPSCLSAPMDEDTSSQHGEVEDVNEVDTVESTHNNEHDHEIVPEHDQDQEQEEPKSTDEEASPIKHNADDSIISEIEESLDSIEPVHEELDDNAGPEESEHPEDDSTSNHDDTSEIQQDESLIQEPTEGSPQPEDTSIVDDASIAHDQEQDITSAEAEEHSLAPEDISVNQEQDSSLVQEEENSFVKEEDISQCEDEESPLTPEELSIAQDEGKGEEEEREAAEEEEEESSHAHEEDASFSEDIGTDGVDVDHGEESIMSSIEYDDDQGAREDDNEESIMSTIEHDEEEDGNGSRRSSSSRRTSKRTEELIKAAARNIVAQIENHQDDTEEEDFEDSMISARSDAETDTVQHDHDLQQHSEHDLEHDLEEASEPQPEHDPEPQSEQVIEHDLENDLEDASEHVIEHDLEDASEHAIERELEHDSEHVIEHDDIEHAEISEAGLKEEEVESTVATDDAADSSSHHEGTDEDVFSDKSPRSSIGSFAGCSDSGKTADIGDNFTVTTRTPRVSDISQYEHDEDDFIPTIRGSKRPPFRTPSDVHAMQMSSPPASLFGSVVGSPRSSKRPFPTVSRLGSPAPSTQYSPRNHTPSRFKVKREEPPLVLLHATLLPLRWMWGDLMDKLDVSEMSQEAKGVRDAWRMLQDRMGDTVIERGILLGHPQNDYEILEERLLEALDLPMRRRARILECGHYLSAANEYTVGDDSDSDDDYDVVQSTAKRHWCNTCKSEIRYDSLGPGRIFRVKVYASNGLMRAGAWAACWKEMERVDVELVPVVDPTVQLELAAFEAALHEREVAQQQQIELASKDLQQIEDRQSTPMLEQPISSPTPTSAPVLNQQEEQPVHRIETSSASRSIDDEQRFLEDHERRLLQEERLREIYGVTPEPEQEVRQTDDSSELPHHSDTFVPQPSPRSPSEEAHERRESRRRSYQSASLPELLLQSVRVLMQDRKNVAIVALSVFVLLMALRTGPQPTQFDLNFYPEVKANPQVMQAPIRAQELPPANEFAATYNPPAAQSIATAPVVVEQVSWLPTVVMSSNEPCVTRNAAGELQEAVGGGVGLEVQQAHKQVPAVADTIVQRRTVKVVETITETETLRIETITETETMRVKVTATVSEKVFETSLPQVEDVLGAQEQTRDEIYT